MNFIALYESIHQNLFSCYEKFEPNSVSFTIFIGVQIYKK